MVKEERDKLLEKLKSDIDTANWDMLADHHERGAVFTVAKHLNLEDVGTALALDEVASVKVWLDNKEFQKLDEIPEDVSKDRDIEFLIVQPYVLIKI